MSTSDAPASTARLQFRRTLITVMSMQLATLLVLALIQFRYN